SVNLSETPTPLPAHQATATPGISPPLTKRAQSARVLCQDTYLQRYRPARNPRPDCTTRTCRYQDSTCQVRIAQAFRGRSSMDSVQSPGREPAVLVHRAVSQNLEILLVVAGGCFGIIERESETHPVHRHLWQAIDLVWRRQAGGFENSWGNISAMGEL